MNKEKFIDSVWNINPFDTHQWIYQFVDNWFDVNRNMYDSYMKRNFKRNVVYESNVIDQSINNKW